MASNTSPEQRPNNNQGQKEPEYTKYASMSQFFNEKRQLLLEKDSARSPVAFQARIAPNTRGERLWPPSAGRPRLARSPEEVAAWRKQGVDKKLATIEDPWYCIRRRQVVEMWKQDVHTESQLKEHDKALPKLKALVKKYKLYKIENETREYTIGDTGAAN